MFTVKCYGKPIFHVAFTVKCYGKPIFHVAFTVKCYGKHHAAFCRARRMCRPLWGFYRVSTKDFGK